MYNFTFNIFLQTTTKAPFLTSIFSAQIRVRSNTNTTRVFLHEATFRAININAASLVITCIQGDAPFNSVGSFKIDGTLVLSNYNVCIRSIINKIFKNCKNCFRLSCKMACQKFGFFYKWENFVMKES